FRGQPVRPGRVFEHAAQVALLLQAADEMLFAETVLDELEFGFRFRARPASPGLDGRRAIEVFGFTRLERARPREVRHGGSGARSRRCSSAPLGYSSLMSRRPARTPTTCGRSWPCSTGSGSGPA